jgi:hypothetical protein
MFHIPDTNTDRRREETSEISRVVLGVCMYLTSQNDLPPWREAKHELIGNEILLHVHVSRSSVAANHWPAAPASKRNGRSSTAPPTGAAGAARLRRRRTPRRPATRQACTRGHPSGPALLYPKERIMQRGFAAVVLVSGRRPRRRAPEAVPQV